VMGSASQFSSIHTKWAQVLRYSSALSWPVS
jgi:hypothetical protein